MWIQWYYSSILNLKKFWIFWMICEHCWSTFWYGSSCKSSLNPLPFYWRTTRGELFPKWMLMIMMFARYLVVSPASFVNWLPSARTAIRNWYIDIEASIAILRPTIWIIQKHFFSHSFKPFFKISQRHDRKFEFHPRFFYRSGPCVHTSTYFSYFQLLLNFEKFKFCQYSNYEQWTLPNKKFSWLKESVYIPKESRYSGE